MHASPAVLIMQARPLHGSPSFTSGILMERAVAKARILLVEDNKTQAAVIRDGLTRNGYEVVHVDNGMAGIKVAKTEPIDLVLLDLLLPDIDGNEVCRWLKLNHDTKALPIIMLTAKGGSNDKVAGLEAGADDYLQKPFDESELNARIYARLRSKMQQDELQQKNRQLESMLTQVETLAIMDSLTGLFNRRRFETILSDEFKKAQRYRSPLACMMIDIDHFKEINDRYGHQAGDVGAAGSSAVHSSRHPRGGHAVPLGRRGVRGAKPEHRAGKRPPRRRAHPAFRRLSPLLGYWTAPGDGQYRSGRLPGSPGGDGGETGPCGRPCPL